MMPFISCHHLAARPVPSGVLFLRATVSARADGEIEKLDVVSAFYMKSPPIQMDDQDTYAEVSRRFVEDKA